MNENGQSHEAKPRFGEQPPRGSFASERSDELDERTFLLREKDAEARHRRLKDLMTSRALLIGLGSTWVVCVVVLFSPGHSAEMRQWATSGITSILAGAVGYLAGRT